MTIECYLKECRFHSKDEPFCYEDECRITDLERKLIAQGYDLDELEQDNPYTQWRDET